MFLSKCKDLHHKVLLSGVALSLVTSLNASSFVSSEENNQMKQFHNDIANFFHDDSFFTAPYKYYRLNLSSNYPKMNLFENKKRYTFEFELPGVDKKDIKVTINNKNILSISGTKKEISKEEKKNLITQERFYGSFSRSVSLPDDINSKKIKVSYLNGILKVVIDKDTAKAKNNIRNLPID